MAMKKDRNFDVQRIRNAHPEKRRIYEVMLYNFDDSTFALYHRDNIFDARLLAREKLECDQVESVEIREKVVLSTPIYIIKRPRI